MTPAVLEIAGVSKNYHALRPLRIHELIVTAGESVALLGFGFDQSAAEVFINLVTGAFLPDAGHIRLFGRATSEIADSADWLATVDRVGIVSARAVLLEPLTVMQNLALPFTLDIEPPPDEVLARAAQLAIEVGLPEALWTRPVADLDAVGHARVRAGRALALDPAVLLLEHVSAGLAPADAVALGADLRSVAARRGQALVAATADEAFAAAVASRVLTLDPATGKLQDRRRSGWFGRRLG